MQKNINENNKIETPKRKLDKFSPNGYNSASSNRIKSNSAQFNREFSEIYQ